MRENKEFHIALSHTKKYHASGTGNNSPPIEYDTFHEEVQFSYSA
jgi:hypothetical protein